MFLNTRQKALAPRILSLIYRLRSDVSCGIYQLSFPNECGLFLGAANIRLNALNTALKEQRNEGGSPS